MKNVLSSFLLILLFVTLSHAGWDSLEVVPEDVGSGGCIVCGGKYVWCIVGEDSDGFYAYDLTGNQLGWIFELDGTPYDIDEAAAITYESGIDRRIFVAYRNQLLIYTKDDPEGYSGEWNDPDIAPAPISLPEECGAGVSLVYQPKIQDGFQTGGYLYLLLGDSTNRFYRRYWPIDTLVGPRGYARYTWERLADIPVIVHRGGAMCYNKRHGYEAESLYALVGLGDTRFYCYSISSDTWIRLDSATPLRQNDGSSITSGYRGKRLYAIFGNSPSTEKHYKYDVVWNRWSDENWLPGKLGSGASITCDGAEDDAYLVVGGDTNCFYVNNNPSDEEKEGKQSEETWTLSKTTKIFHYPDRVVIHYTDNIHTKVRINIYNLLGNQIKTLFTSIINTDKHQAVWNKTDNTNQKVPHGIYFIVIDKEKEPERLKVIIK